MLETVTVLMAIVAAVKIYIAVKAAIDDRQKRKKGNQ